MIVTLSIGEIEQKVKVRLRKFEDCETYINPIDVD